MKRMPPKSKSWQVDKQSSIYARLPAVKDEKPASVVSYWEVLAEIKDTHFMSTLYLSSCVPLIYIHHFYTARYYVVAFALSKCILGQKYPSLVKGLIFELNLL